MTQEKVVRKLIDGVESANRSADYLAQQIKNLEESKLASDDDEEGEDKKVDYDWLIKLVPKMLDDRKIALDYLKELNKMCGTYAPIKKDVTSDGKEITSNVHMYLPDNGRNRT